MEPAQRRSGRRIAVLVSASVVVVAVVVTVVVAAGWTVSGDDPSAAKATPPPTASSASTPTSNPTPTSFPSPTFVPTGRTQVALTLDGLAEGLPARTAWLQRQTLHLADGSTVQVPLPAEGGHYLNVEPYRGGWVGVFEEANGGPKTDVIDPAGSAVSRYGGSERFAVRLDGSAFAWDDGDTLTVSSTSSSPTPDTRLVMSRPAFSPVGWTDPDHVVYNAGGEEGTAEGAYVTDVASPEATRRDVGVPVPDAEYAASASETSHMVAVVTQASHGACSQVQSADGSVVAFKTCAYRLEGFSSDGRYIAAVPRGTQDQLVVLDASTGEVVLDASASTNVAVVDVTWDGDTEDVLTQLDDRSDPDVPRVALVRIALDGSEDEIPGVDPSSFVDFLSRG